MSDDYKKGGLVVGGIAFLFAWVYAIATYGFFLGLGLGWIPAAVIGLIAGLLWPVVVIAIAAGVLLIWYFSRH